LLINIATRIGATSGDSRYNAAYDLDHNNTINVKDLFIALRIPVCGHEHDDDDD